MQTFTLLALASSALAAHVPRGGGGYGGPGWGEVTTHIATTYTTLCPITETITKSGKPEYVTRTELSVVTKQVPVTYYTTIEKVDTKTAYTTFVKTAWEETKVYQTVTCPETVITTVSAGHTVYLTKTNTYVPLLLFPNQPTPTNPPRSITKYITDVKTYTKNLPITVTKNVDTVVAVTQPGAATVTDYHTVVVSVPNTIYSTAPPAPPTTVVIPVTSSVVPPPPVTTTPPPVTAGAAQAFPAGAALIAGLVAALL